MVPLLYWVRRPKPETPFVTYSELGSTELALRKAAAIKLRRIGGESGEARRVRDGDGGGGAPTSRNRAVGFPIST